MSRKLFSLLTVCMLLSAGSAYGAIDAAWNAFAADKDSEVAPYSGGHALTLFNIGGVFTFDGDGMFTELDDGTAQLMGTLKHGNGSEWDLVVNFDNKTEAVDYFAEGKSPKLELYNEAYVSTGPNTPFVGAGSNPVMPAGKQESVDPNDWRFYEMIDGMMMRVSVPGEEFTLTPRPVGLDPEGQVGIGANGKNLEMGLAQWVYNSYSGGIFGSPYAKSSGTGGDFNLELTPKDTGVVGGGGFPGGSGVPEPVTGVLGMIGLAALTGGTRRRR